MTGSVLADILTDPALSRRSDVLVGALPFIVEADLEALLLHALDGPTSERDVVLAAIWGLHPTTWTGMANVTRALRWRGVADYADEHRQLIEDVDPVHKGTWGVLLNGDIADAMPGTADEVWETLRRLSPTTNANEALEHQRAKQKPGRAAFQLLGQWLAETSLPTQQPSSSEWAHVGEILFFARHLGIDRAFGDALAKESLDASIAAAPLNDLAALSLGLGEIGDDWRARHRTGLIDAYRRATNVTRVVDDGTRIAIDFIHPVTSSEEGSDASGGVSSNREAVDRLDLLRRLVPDRERYASQGWGHRVIDAAPDDTTKDIERRRLPPLWLTSVNAGFRGYVERWWRDPSWSAYLSKMLDERASTCERLERITAALVRYHRRRSGGIIGVDLSETQLLEWVEHLSVQHLLPEPAVDRWGFVDESSIRSSAARQSQATYYGLALEPYDDYYRAHRDYFRPLSNFAGQCAMTLAVVGVLGRTKAVDQDAVRSKLEGAGGNLNAPQLSVGNLYSTYEALPALQSESRRLFGYAIPEELERREERSLLRAVVTWESFVRSPWIHSDDIAREAWTRIDRGVRSWHESVLGSLSEIDPGVRWTVDSVRDVGMPGCLVIAADGPDGAATHAALEVGLTVVHRALVGLSAHVVLHIRSRWPTILLVPMISGRPLASEGIQLSTLVVAGSDWEPQWWHFVPRPLSESSRRLLPSEPWTLDSLRVAYRLATSVGTLGSLCLHVSDLPRPDDLDGLGKEILDEHVASLSPSPGEAWQEASTSLVAFRTVVEGATERSDDWQTLLDIATAIQERLNTAPGWPTGDSPPHEDIVAWSGGLGELFALVGLARIGWATIAVRREHGE